MIFILKNVTTICSLHRTFITDKKIRNRTIPRTGKPKLPMQEWNKMQVSCDVLPILKRAKNRKQICNNQLLKRVQETWFILCPKLCEKCESIVKCTRKDKNDLNLISFVNSYPLVAKVHAQLNFGMCNSLWDIKDILSTHKENKG